MGGHLTRYRELRGRETDLVKRACGIPIVKNHSRRVRRASVLRRILAIGSDTHIHDLLRLAASRRIPNLVREAKRTSVS